MKKLVIIFLAVLLIAGATIGVMKWLAVGPFAKPPEEGQPVAAPKIEAPEALFVDMEPLMINVVEAGQILTTIQMEIKLETVGNDNIIAIKRALPKYKDAFMKDLHAFVPRMYSEIQRLDLPTLKQRLQLVADRVAGKPGIVRGVLIQSVLDTPQK